MSNQGALRPQKPYGLLGTGTEDISLVKFVYLIIAGDSGLSSSVHVTSFEC